MYMYIHTEHVLLMAEPRTSCLWEGVLLCHLARQYKVILMTVASIMRSLGELRMAIDYK